MISFGKNEADLERELKKLDSVTGIDSINTKGYNLNVQVEVTPPEKKGKAKAASSINLKFCCSYEKKNADTEDCIKDAGADERNLCDGEIDPEDFTIKGWMLEKPENVTAGGLMSALIKKSRRDNKTALYHALRDYVLEMKSNENIVVLCYAGCSREEKAQKIHTQWIVVNPAVPFEMKNGFPSFPMLEIMLTESEFELCMESRLALYNEYSDDVYPIRNVAFSSIGKLLDSAASFKNMADIPLGSALLLAEKLSSDMKSLKLIFRNMKGHIKPLIGIAGNRFAPYKEEDFFKTLIGKADEMFGPVGLDSWFIYEDMTVVNLELATTKNRKNHNEQMTICACAGDMMSAYAKHQDEFKILLRIQTSDIPGVSASVTAIAKFGQAEVQICRNSAYHWEAFLRNGMDSLMEPVIKKKKHPISEDIYAFIKKIEKLQETDIKYNDKIHNAVKDIINLIGKRRIEDEKSVINSIFLTGDSANGYELFVRILSTYTELPSKQGNELMVKYGEAVDLLCS